MRFSLIFGVKRVPFTDPASTATFLCVAKLKLLPCSMLLLLLQLLSRWAVSATAVPVARMQRHRLLLRRPRQSTQQLAAAAGAISSGGGGEFGELLLPPRPRAARLSEKIGASLTEESAHFGFGPTQIFFPWENQKDAHLKMKHDGAFVLEFGRREVPCTRVGRNRPFSPPYVWYRPHPA